MECKTIYTSVAYRAIKNYLMTNDVLKLNSVYEELNLRAACFVTLKTKEGNLRGCIGTILPTKDNLQNEIISNAISSATKDYRFNKVAIDELEELKISVEILTEPEKISDKSLLNPKKYGLIIEYGKLNRGVLLPNIEGVDTIDRQIEIVKRKAGIKDILDKNLDFYRFTSTKYY